MIRVPIIYDQDCGFCRFLLARVLSADWGGFLEPVRLDSPRAAELLAELDPEERSASWHLVMGGRRYSGGAAFEPLAEMLPRAKPLAPVFRQFPGPVDRAYRWVAANRSKLSRFVPASWKDGADERIARAAVTGPAAAGRTG